MKLDVSGVGNHEFDEGLTELLRMQNGGCNPDAATKLSCFEGSYDGAAFPWLAANVVYEGTNNTVLPATWTRTIPRSKGLKIGFIGMTLEGTDQIVSAAGIQGLDFQDEIEAGKRAADKLNKQGVKAIVVLLHEGVTQVPNTNPDGCVNINGPARAIAEGMTSDVDLMITGHTHQPYICTINDPAGNPRVVTSAYSFGRLVTETNFTIDPVTRDVIRSSVSADNHIVANGPACCYRPSRHGHRRQVDAQCGRAGPRARRQHHRGHQADPTPGAEMTGRRSRRWLTSSPTLSSPIKQQHRVRRSRS